MKCTVSASALASCLTLVSRAVSPRSTLPVLGNVLLETTAGGLRVTATNLDLTISATVAAEVGRGGQVDRPGPAAHRVRVVARGGALRLELDPGNQVLKVSCGVHRTKFHGISAAEFPPLPARDGEQAVEVESARLQGAITQTAMAASSDEASPVLTGVLLQIDGGKLTLAATDRHRLAVKTLEAEVVGEPLEAVSVIVPARHLLEVARAVNSNRPVVRVALSAQRNQVFLTIGDVEVSSRLIEGNYPNYAQVIPGESSTTVSLPTAALLREARTASVLARDAANPVRLRIGSGTLTLVAQTAEVGDDEAPLEATVKGDEVQIAFNARYMLDALAVLDSDEVSLSFNGSLSPGVIRPVGRDDYLCIIMPVRVPM